MTSPVLLVDDDVAVLEGLELLLRGGGYDVHAVSDPRKAVADIEKRSFLAVVTDFKMARVDGLEIVRVTRKFQPNAPVFLVTAYSTVENAVEAFRLGVTDYLIKPVIGEDLLKKLEKAIRVREIESENERLRRSAGRGEIIGSSVCISKLQSLIAKIAESDATVLITGESGTGKELVARKIHSQSARAKKSFVSVNCAAIPDNLLESELFGHVKGAYTGADTTQEGMFVQLSSGTLCLDEIGTLPLNLQAKLLRAIEEREIIPVGASVPVKTEVRMIASTNEDLAARVKEGAFREDLYFRLKVIPVEVPPLRERPMDVRELLAHFVERYSNKNGAGTISFDDDALDALSKYSWPGNVRELRNLVERLTMLLPGETIGMGELPDEFTMSAINASGNYRDAVRGFQREYIVRTLGDSAWVRQDAAKKLGVSTTTLWRLMSDLGITDVGG
ncbi:MAG: sigma-54 dependent transcriptional regulator [Planctomycetes bacterium]|nr:sigma-54 dependent transcriptional regulator [Planctomycetota bacterium]